MTTVNYDVGMDFLEPLIGGALIGLGSLLTLATSGQITGISGLRLT